MLARRASLSLIELTLNLLLSAQGENTTLSYSRLIGALMTIDIAVAIIPEQPKVKGLEKLPANPVSPLNECSQTIIENNQDPSSGTSGQVSHRPRILHSHQLDLEVQNRRLRISDELTYQDQFMEKSRSRFLFF